MISKELEQELEDNGLRYEIDNDGYLSIFSKEDKNIGNMFIKKNGECQLSIYSQELKQAELIIKLAKEWQDDTK